MNRFIKDTKKYWKYTIYAAKSQLKTEVANSYLNWIWWILEPFCFMLIYAFVFGLMFHHKDSIIMPIFLLVLLYGISSTGALRVRSEW